MMHGCALGRSRGTFFPVMQGCDHVLWCLLGQEGDGWVIELSRTTPRQDPFICEVNRRPPAPGLKGAGTIFPTSSSPCARMPSVQNRFCSGAGAGKSVSAEVLALEAWQSSWHSCVEEDCDVWSAS